MACAPEPKANIERAVACIVEAAELGAQVICLQELFSTPYLCQTEDEANFSYAEPLDGALVQVMQSIARAQEVVIVVPIFD